MLLDSIVEQVVRAVSAGLDTADGRYEPDYVEDKVHEYRIKQLIESYNGSRTRAASKFIHYSYYQNFDIVLVDALQVSGANYLRFECPVPVNISDKVDGLTFVGNKKKGVSWSKVKSPEHASVLVKLGEFNENNIGYFYDGQFLRLYGNLDLTQIHLEGIFQNPNLVPDFNPEVNNYPMPDDEIPSMIEMMKRMEFNQIAASVPDIIVDGADTNTQAILRTNKR